MNLFLKPIRILSLLLLSAGFVACGSNDEPLPENPTSELANRTVLVYMMAENSLSNYAEKGTYDVESDIDEMIAGASYIPDGDHLIVFIDDANKSQNPRIYEILKAEGNTAAQARLVTLLDEDVCSTDPAVLQEVMGYVQVNFPASSYGLVMWSHGSGWLPVDEDKKKDSRSIGVDNELNNSSNNGIEMDIPDLAEVLARLGGVDFLYFDACFMQCIEVAYELRNVADYVIGCPAETPSLGARYDRIISPMFASTVDVAGIVNANYEYYQYIYDTTDADDYLNYGCLLSAIRCSELEALAAVTRPLIAQYAGNTHLLAIGNNVQSYGRSSGYPDFYDMNGVMNSILLEDEYAEWLSQFNATVVSRQHTPEWYGGNGSWFAVAEEEVSPYGGVSMYVPKISSAIYDEWNGQFQTTAWYKAVWNGTGW